MRIAPKSDTERSSPFALRQAQEAQDEEGYRDTNPTVLILSLLSLSKGEG
jgi:hypothetical protein